MKNKQKGVILLAASLLCSVSGMAQNASDKIVVSSAEVNFLSAIDSVQSITFNENGFTVTKNDGSSSSFGYDGVITFTDETTGIKSAQLSKGDLRVYSTPGSSLINIEGAKAGTVEVFSTSGALVVRQLGWNGQPVDVGSLPKGVYILRVGGQSFKFNK